MTPTPTRFDKVATVMGKVFAVRLMAGAGATALGLVAWAGAFVWSHV
jgi:hypothetical protein